MVKGIQFSLILSALTAAAAARAAAPEVVPGEYLVRTRHLGDYSLTAFGTRLQGKGLRIKETISRQNDLYLVKVDRQKADVRATLTGLGDVESFEPNYVVHALNGAKPPKTPKPVPAPVPAPTPTPTPAPSPTPPASGKVTPNDPAFGQLWGMTKIFAPQAWSIARGVRSVVVAIIDTGIDYNHPDLKDNIWSQPGKPSVHGYNAISGAEDPMDDHYHGTHCAGTIGGVADNAQGVAGVAWEVSLMGVKFLDSSGSGTTAGAIKAIDWAREHGAQIMSNSWGGGGYSQELADAISRTRDAGIVFIAAAGNETNDNDANPTYPAGYKFDNVVAVAATDSADNLAGFSNWGAKTVDLGAPGVNIYSTSPSNKYRTLSGTSMATPHVSGAVAVLLAKEPALKPAEVKARLRASSDPVASLKGKVFSNGRLNLYRLVSGN